MPTSKNATRTSDDSAGFPDTPSKASAWVAACRPRTLSAGAVPVVVGTAVAVDQDVVAWGAAAAALTGALLIQVGTNLANDYYDHVKGADSPTRLGRPRAAASGGLPPVHVRNAAFGVFGLAAVVGAYLTWVAGWPILVIGAASILFGILYTAGPKPLGYIGLGDILVFVFFGPVAVAGTYYAQASAWEPLAIASGVPVGALATAILAVNNLRDIPTDKVAGKRTLAVLVGPGATRAEYVFLTLIAYASLPLLALMEVPRDWKLLLPLVMVPLAVALMVHVLTARDAGRLNRLLEATAAHLALFGLALAAGWWL
jgi:1,4-dihydroxy-2-naphthoate octaprenyltransferase